MRDPIPIKKSFFEEVNRHAGLLVCLVLVLVTLVVYMPVKEYGFVTIDDGQYVTRNPLVLPGLTAEGLRGAFSWKTEPYWHPLTWVSHQLDTELFGLNPAGHHWNNLLLHALNALLLFMFLNKITGRLWCSAAVALLFAVHPLNVESVAWVSSRKNLLAAFWGMLTFFAYSGYAKRPGLFRYGILLACFGLSLMAKPMLVTLPLLLLAIDVWPLGRLPLTRVLGPQPDTFFRREGIHPSPPSRVILEKAPLLLLSVLSVLVSLITAQDKDFLVSKATLPVTLRIENGVLSLVTYISKMFWPSDLAFFYPYPDAISNWASTGSGLLVLAVSLLFTLLARRAPYLLAGWAWYLILILPVIGLVQQGLWPAWADRFAYLPIIGLFIAVVWVVGSLAQAWKPLRIAAIPGFLVAILILGICARHQTRYWSNDELLLRRAIETSPPNHLAHNNLGALLLSKGRVDEAILHYSKAAEILPENPLFHYSLGSALITQGKFEDAARHLEVALRLSPSYPEIHTNLGVALAGLGETERAVRHLQTAIAIRPMPEAYHNLGIIHARQGRYEQAVSSYRSALKLSAADPMLHNDLGVALVSLRDYPAAVHHLSESLRLDPVNKKVQENLRFVQEQFKEAEGERPKPPFRSQDETQETVTN